MAALNRFELDGSCRRVGAGRILIGGSPLRLFRLSEAGARVVDVIANGGALAAGHEQLTSRLADAGAIHPVVEGGGSSPGPGPGDVTLVIPAYDADPERLTMIVTATGAARAIVVDDASRRALPPIDGAEVVRLDANAGPGAARQHGLDHVTTEFVAFVDADVTVPPGWLDGLLPHFADPAVALVAPRVRAADGHRALERFDAVRSPLDLGTAPARVRAGSRVSYVPAAALVCRVKALRHIGGFDAAMRVGEDVDLVWRLDEAGWRCRYEPSVEVLHDVRPDIGSWLRQRFGYGTSATELARRHPGAAVPAQLSAWSAAAWTLPMVGAPLGGLAVAAGSTTALVAKLPEMPDRGREALRLAGLGHLHAGRILASAVTRAWWPIAFALALISRRARRALLLAALVPSLAEWWKVRHRIDATRYVALRLLDDAAYGAGVWRGALKARSSAALRPDLASWPRPPRYRRSAQESSRVATVPTDSSV